MAQYRGKVGAVYAGITDFSLQLQRSEKPGTELGKPWTVSAPAPVARLGVERVTQNGGVCRGRPMPVRSALAPVPAGWAAAARERPRCGACHGAPSSRRCQRSAALRVAGTWAMSAQRWHTPALGALALEDERPCQGKRMPPYSYRPALGGRREYGGHTPSWQGRAVRGGSPRGGVSIGLAASRTAPGSGCPLRPRDTGRKGWGGWGRQNGWASRPPATKPEASRRTRDAAAKRMSDGAGIRLERPERP